MLDGDSHVGAYSKGTAPILAHQVRTHDMKAKGNADPKPRPLSSAILGPSWPRGRDFYFYSTSLLLYPPQVSPDSGGWSFRYCNQSPRTYQRKTPWLLSFGVRVFLQLRTVWLLITNNLTFLLRSRFQQGLFHPVCRFSVALLAVALLYARNGEP